LEPRQSIQLRGVLQQQLSQLRTDGVLPRECTIRKGSLDDCIGEKFEELLLFFSTLVLRKTLESQGQLSTPARTLSVAASLDGDELHAISSLSLAYSASLHASLAERQRYQQRLAGLCDKFRQEENDFETRQSTAETCLASSTSQLTLQDVDIPSMKQQLRDEHNGDHVWLELAMNGSSEEGRRKIVEDEFEVIWKPTISGDDISYDVPANGLLADLEQRVTAQNARLGVLRALQIEVSQRNEQLTVMPSPMKSPMKTPMKTTARSPIKARLIRNNSTPMKKPTLKPLSAVSSLMPQGKLSTPQSRRVP
jgi:hypothetical protein